MKKNNLLFTLIMSFALLVFSDDGYATLLFLEKTKPDSSHQKRNGMLYLPILFYQPETKLAGGAVVGYYFREAESKIISRPSTVVTSFAYTQKQQITATLAPDIYWRNETYINLPTRKFWKSSQAACWRKKTFWEVRGRGFGRWFAVKLGQPEQYFLSIFFQPCREDQWENRFRYR